MAMSCLSLPCGAWGKQITLSVHSLRLKAVRRARMRVSPLQISAQTEFSIAPPYGALVADAVKALRSEFEDVDTLVAANLQRVIKAYANARVGSHHFAGTTGYGHNDAGGRDALDEAFAEIVGAEAAIVRSQFFSGTHAIACALYAALRPGGELLAVAGAPYDTLEEVIGLRGSSGEGSLKECGVSYSEVPVSSGCRFLPFIGDARLFCLWLCKKGEGSAHYPLSVSDGHFSGCSSCWTGAVIIHACICGQYVVRFTHFSWLCTNLKLAEDGGLDWDALSTAVKPETQCALIQRSCGYSWRKTLTVGEIQRAIELIKAQSPHCVVVVDNCYGEFVETIEPTAVGADLMAGSLIKNPGGTIAPCGGYVAGNSKWVQAAAARLCAPGIGMSAGSTTGDVMRLLFQGLFLAPQMVGEAIKGTLLVAEVMAAEGFSCQPAPRVRRYDIIQAVQLGSRERLLAFCRAAQKCCPVGSYIQPVAGATAGYESEVVFADGTFIDGSTSELSCDGPLREPFVVFCQGGTHWTHWALALEGVVQALRQLQ